MPDQNQNRRNNMNPNDSDNLKHLREQNQQRSDELSDSPGMMNSMKSSTPLGMKSDGTGQNYSGGTGSQATDQNRSGSMSGQTGSEDAAGRMFGHDVQGSSARQSGTTVTGKSGSVDQQDQRSDLKDEE